MCRSLIIFVILFALAAPAAMAEVSFADGQEGFAAVAQGPAAASWNPANLAMYPGTQVELFGLRGGFGNNSYSMGDYAHYNGTYWDASMKAEILGKIKSSELEMSGNLNARVVGFKLGALAFTTETFAHSQIGMPKQMIELILNGNTVGETFSVDGSSGKGMAYTEIRLSAGNALSSLLPMGDGRLSDWYGGVSFKMLRGWAYGELLDATGGVTTSEEMVYGDGYFRSQFADGGEGFGLDIGFAGPVSENWIGSFAMRDLFSTLTWTGKVEEQINTFSVPGLVLGDSVSVNSSTVTRSLESVETALPMTFAFGVARQGERLLTALNLELASESRFGGGVSPRVAFGAAWRMKSWLMLRSSAAAGGDYGSTIGGSLGTAIGPCNLDLGICSWGSLNPFGSKGMGVTGGLSLGW